MASEWRSIWAQVGSGLRGTASRLALAWLLAAPAGAEERVSLELVLAVDVSLSVNDIEYAFEMQGVANAFLDPDVAALIARRDRGVAVVLTQWSGTYRAVVPMPWRVLTDGPSLRAFAGDVASLPRARFGNYTGLGNAIAFAAELIAGNDYVGDEMKIDVAGDGRNNTGPEPRAARALALAQGITVNGLAIVNSEPDLDRYYEENVMAGPAAFVIAARDFEDFAEAFRRKLRRELAPRVAEARP